MLMQGQGTATFDKRVQDCTTSVRYPISSPPRDGRRPHLHLIGPVDSDKIF